MSGCGGYTDALMFTCMCRVIPHSGFFGDRSLIHNMQNNFNVCGLLEIFTLEMIIDLNFCLLVCKIVKVFSIILLHDLFWYLIVACISGFRFFLPVFSFVLFQFQCVLRILAPVARKLNLTFWMLITRHEDDYLHRSYRWFRV